MSLIRFLVFALLTLCVLVPLAGIFSLVGLPIALVIGIVAVPVLLLLVVIGLPVILTVVLVMAAVAIVTGLLGAVVGLGFAALKIALFVALPVWIVFWLAGKVSGRRTA